MDWRQVVGRQLEFYRVMDLETQLTTSKWGIREPDPQQVAHSGVRAGAGGCGAVGLWGCGAVGLGPTGRCPQCAKVDFKQEPPDYILVPGKM